MPYRKEKFENGDVAHLILKGIDGNLLFKDIDDYYRMIFSIYELNNTNPTEIRIRRKIREQFKKRESCGGPTSVTFEDDRERMVDILCFSFMPNHIHLLVRQIKDNGITEFVRKIGTGYAGYVIRKYNRKGHIFQGSFKAVKIATDEQLAIVSAYIHTNPISLVYKNWKKIRIGKENLNKKIKFLKNYKWSSWPDYLGVKNFPSVTQRSFILELFKDKENLRRFVNDYVRSKGKERELKFPEVGPPQV